MRASRCAQIYYVNFFHALTLSANTTTSFLYIFSFYRCGLLSVSGWDISLIGGIRWHGHGDDCCYFVCFCVCFFALAHSQSDMENRVARSEWIRNGSISKQKKRNKNANIRTFDFHLYALRYILNFLG